VARSNWVGHWWRPVWLRAWAGSVGRWPVGMLRLGEHQGQEVMLLNRVYQGGVPLCDAWSMVGGKGGVDQAGWHQELDWEG